MAAGSQYFDEAHDADVPKKIRPTLELLVKRHLPPDAFKWPHEKIVSALDSITHVRLDRENLAYIDNFELLGEHVTNLYLQKNQIEIIENLESLRGLQFLTLAANRIRRIEGLTRLPKLGFLDLSENLIETFDIDEIPQSLIILNLRGNPCTQLADYRGSIIQDIEKLQQLDGEKVTKEEKKDAGYAVSSDDDDAEDDDITSDGTTKTETRPAEYFDAVMGAILERSQDRVESLWSEHKGRLEQLKEMRGKSPAPPMRKLRHDATGHAS
ncbi:hypothetical protein NP493_584g01028 [Ridgeia piscesae]|uniref:Uncharacterized protein n=1 Tax=Ridgeia piscesae TaxID=27915 RepID=A0AAD9KTR6_RIDPI|nr:hypothetical protein NP493_584g01028 [Ridgeia piscesae]